MSNLGEARGLYLGAAIQYGLDVFEYCRAGLSCLAPHSYPLVAIHGRTGLDAGD